MAKEILDQLSRRGLVISRYQDASKLFFSKNVSSSFFADFDKANSNILTPEVFEKTVIDYAASIRKILDQDAEFANSAPHLLKDFHARLKSLDEKYLFTYKYKHLLYKSGINELENKNKFFEDKYRELDNDTQLSRSEKDQMFLGMIEEHRQVRSQYESKYKEISEDVNKYNNYLSDFNVDLSVSSFISDMHLILGTILNMKITEETKKGLYSVHDSVKSRLNGLRKDSVKEEQKRDDLCLSYGVHLDKKIVVGKTFKMPPGTVDEKGNTITQVSVLDPRLFSNEPRKEERKDLSNATEEIANQRGLPSEKDKQDTTKLNLGTIENKTIQSKKDDEEVLEPITINRKKEEDPFARYNLGGHTEERDSLIAFRERMLEKKKDMLSRASQGVQEFREEHYMNPAKDMMSLVNDINNKRKFKIGDLIEFNGYRGAYMNDSVFRYFNPGDRFVFLGYGSDPNKIRIEGTYIDSEGNLLNVPENKEFFANGFDKVNVKENNMTSSKSL